MTSSTLRSVAIVLAFIGTVLAAIATGTMYWIYVEGTINFTATERLGLFESCTTSSSEEGEECQTYSSGGVEDGIICGDHTSHQSIKFMKGLQSMSILSAAFGFLAFAMAVWRSCSRRSSTSTSGLGSLVETVSAFAGAGCAFVTWTGFVYFILSWVGCGTSYCEVQKGTIEWDSFQCGFHYSFALSVASSVLLGASGTLFMIDYARSQHELAVGDGIYQDTNLVRCVNAQR